MKYDGKFASRWRAKSPDALCAVLPYIRLKKPITDYVHFIIAYPLSIVKKIEQISYLLCSLTNQSVSTEKKNRRSLPKRRFFVCKSLSPSSSHAHRFRESIMPVPYLSVPAVPAVQKCCCSAPVQWGSSSSSPPLRHPVPFYGIRYG